jgi:hypothetical protein
MPFHTPADHFFDVKLASFPPFQALKCRLDLAAQFRNSALPVAHQTQSIEDYL